MRNHLLKRFGFFILGLILLYAPAALLMRALVHLSGSNYLPDCHRVCLRMPIEWMSQPWMYPTMFRQPLYLIAILALPAAALLFGPLFCGWLCPAGGITEFLSRLVPRRLQMDPGKHFDPAAVKYGVLAGTLIAPFAGAYISCSFCNFALLQNLVNAMFGRFQGISHWASFTIATFVVWFVVLGLFTRGGRGWCTMVCPSGALMSLAHGAGARLGFGRAIRVDRDECKGCGSCAEACPARAIVVSSPARVRTHSCLMCLDCLHACPRGALSYGRIKAALDIDSDLG